MSNWGPPGTLLAISTIAMVALILWGLSSCTTAQVEFPDGTKASFQRFASDADIQMSPDGTLHYSSSPSAIAQQNANIMLSEALRAALGVVSPIPSLRGAPQAYRPLAVPPGPIERLSSPETGI